MKFALLSLCLLFSGCAQIAANDRLDELRETFTPLVGKATDSEVANRWGPPDRREAIGGVDYWVYVWDYGSRHGGAAVYNPYTHTAQYYGRTRARYDKITLQFQNGVLVKWDAEVQR